MVTARKRPQPWCRHAEAPVGAPVPASLLKRPIDYIQADHDRQRIVCATLRRFAASGEADAAAGRIVARFLTVDVVLNHADESEDVYPALRRRFIAADELDRTLGHLDTDHAALQDVLGRIAAALAPLESGPTVQLSRAEAGLLDEFASEQHRHLAVENAIVLPIARVRLLPDDLAAISHTMTTRRAKAAAPGPHA